MQAASANYRAIGALSQQISALRKLVIGAQADNRIFKQGNYQHPGSVAKDSGEHSCEHRRTRNPHSDTISNDSGEFFSNSSLSGSPSPSERGERCDNEQAVYNSARPVGCSKVPKQQSFTANCAHLSGRNSFSERGERCSYGQPVNRSGLPVGSAMVPKRQPFTANCSHVVSPSKPVSSPTVSILPAPNVSCERVSVPVNTCEQFPIAVCSTPPSARLDGELVSYDIRSQLHFVCCQLFIQGQQSQSELAKENCSRTARARKYSGCSCFQP